METMSLNLLLRRRMLVRNWLALDAAVFELRQSTAKEKHSSNIWGSAFAEGSCCLA